MKTKEVLSLKNRMLVAMPSLKDPYFKEAVIYIFEHSSEGAMGMIINKPSDMMLDSIFDHLNIPVDDPDVLKYPVLRGGPVAHEHGFLLHREANVGHGIVANEKHNIIISASKEDLITIPQKRFENIIVTLGYSGWASGQLEEELSQNSWIIVPFDEKILFDIPYQDRWKAAAQLVGVDMDKMVGEIGHA